MERVFLDAGVLFSSAYYPGAWFRDLWDLEDVELCTSPYAIQEALRNLEEEAQRERLRDLVRTVRVAGPSANTVVSAGLSAPDLVAKDVPILAGAIETGADVLLTTDKRHFGSLLGKRVRGVRIESVFEYLRRVRRKR